MIYHFEMLFGLAGLNFAGSRNKISDVTTTTMSPARAPASQDDISSPQIFS